MKRVISAGGLVVRENKVLIRRPSPNPEFRGNLGWSFPKGMMDEGEDLEQTALREVREEGGVNAKIVKRLPTLKVFFKDKDELTMKFIAYFVMDFEEELEEGFGWETAEVKWVTKSEALELLAFKNEKELLNEI